MNIEADRVLEAEQALETMVEELRRMKQATQLLSESQSQLSTSQEMIEKVIGSSETILQRAGDFTKASDEIIKRLKEVDLERRLTDLDQIGSSTNSKLDNLSQATQKVKREVVDDVEDRLSKIRTHMDEQLEKQQNEFDEGVESKLTKFRNYMEEKLSGQEKKMTEGLESVGKKNVATMTISIFNLVLIITVFIYLLASAGN